MIQNPILRGFNPDASIIRVEDDYYIATSTFEWFPGVIIHHSKDLIHWRQLARPLDRVSQLNLKGIPSSGGVWAPSLSYSDGVFYLCYTNVVGRKGVYKDLYNYVVTAPSIEGPWSDPVYLNSSGFDHFLFHDEDGSKWLFNMQWDFRKNQNSFAGIIMQQYDQELGKPVGPVKLITKGTHLGVTEGPMVYQRNGFYYLLLAEGGTGEMHAATLMRSRSLEGPYEVDPDYPLLTTVGSIEHLLQKAGHGSLVETQQGEWYMVHICSRPLFDGSKLSPLGRETSIQKVIWNEDGWLKLDSGSRLPELEVAAPNLPIHPFPELPSRNHFDEHALGMEWSSLRVPVDESWITLRERKGYLRLYGRESLVSWHEQSLVARRLSSLNCEASTCVEFEPSTFMQMAGLVLYYDESDHFYLCVSWDEHIGKHIKVIVSQQGVYDELGKGIKLEEGSPIYLKAVVYQEKTQFRYSLDEVNWIDIGPALYTGVLSDEYGGKLSFTGAFAGVCVQDLGGTRLYADFDYFDYKEMD